MQAATLHPDVREALSWVEVPAEDDPCGGAGAVLDPRYTQQAVLGGHTVSGAALPGIGWVDAATVANLFASLPMRIARAVLDADTGTLSSLTATAYRPPTAMAELVRSRDGTCRMWGCTRAATHTDLDHTRPWPEGRTTPTNLAALCRRHHRMKQRGRWRPTLHPDATLTWTNTTGRARTTEPAHRALAPARG
ncbi:HNH endonuclease signature motif containing protein [Oryzobacter terrae]|uniref:HNH endonuclease signature motif containing protein n=1 Tax=Oryzobacter terrae TaxID=1620385 RepID=UPI0036720EB3